MQPVIILGAPRSGTNMLRDAVTSFKQCDTWPCDEINFIWRYKNANHPSDELQLTDLTLDIRQYIRKKFAHRQIETGADLIVEKTCANCLRVPFVDEIFPDARYLYIKRDPRDAIASALFRWVAPFELFYTLKKLRYVPVSEMPVYIQRFFYYRAYSFFNTKNRLKSWGPRYHNIDVDLNDRELVEVVAKQWLECVSSVESALNSICCDRKLVIEYEDFVKDPQKELGRVCNFLDISYVESDIDVICKLIVSNNVGKYKLSVSQNDLVKINDILEAKG